ncbi:MAG: ABC transporter substrate-binding protein [Deltaproteobacteria bacterium]|nr:ABC transporter substrate-binding protein [Deltaproteobacteria bacterium]
MSHKEKRDRKSGITRRDFVKGMGGLAGAAIAGSRLVPSAWAKESKKLVFVNFGGEAVPAMRAAWVDPFEKETGVKVTIQSPTNYAKLKGMVESGNVIWDVVDTDVDFAIRGGRQHILEPIDYSVVDENNVDFTLEYGVPPYYYSYVMAWRADMFKGVQPQTWADFWDVKKFPGKRGLWRWMYGVLEAALLADGVPFDKVYPIDEKRALRKIKELKPHVVSFWESGADPIQLLREGEATMCAVWNTRALVLKRQTKGKAQYTYNQAILQASVLVVPRGAPNKENAMRFINGILKPERQAKLFELLGNGPVNPAALKYVPEELRIENPSDPRNKEVQLPLGVDWYANNYERVLNDYLDVIS